MLIGAIKIFVSQQNWIVGCPSSMEGVAIDEVVNISVEP